MASIVDYARSILQEQPSYEQKAEQPARSASAYPQARSEAGELPFSGGVRGSGSVFPAQAEGSDQEVALEGLPTRVKIPATGEYVTAGPDPRVRQVARQYMQEAGLPYNPPAKYARVDPARSQRIADAYEQMPHDPEHPLAQAAYQQMAKEVMDQYAAAKRAGFKAEFWDPETEEDPYAASPRLAIEDIRKNHHMYVFPTFSGYGQAEITEEDLRQNPLLADSGERWNGKPVTINDIFRAIHDYYGHAKEGVGFRADGEENAWRAHASMFSPLARLAMTAETRGQNSWVNYGPKGEENRTASGADTVFADQKIGLVPLWVLHEGAEDFMDPQEIEHLKGLYERHGKANGGKIDRSSNLERYLQGNHPAVPERLLHVTTKDFSSFEPEFGIAAWAAGPEFADDFARSKFSYWKAKHLPWEDQPSPPNKGNEPWLNYMPVHLSAKNPFDSRKFISELSAPLRTIDQVIPLAKELKLDPRQMWDAIPKTKKTFDGQESPRSLLSADILRNQVVTDRLRELGHDSFIGHEFDQPVYAVFEPTQIKSATGNQGTFDPNDPDITKAQGGEVDDRYFSPVPGVEAYHEDPAFQEWFGNSVTHREGVPVTYYTGTSKDVDFNKFNVGRHGAWFTADPAEASGYAVENDSMGYRRDGWDMKKVNTASRVIPAHLKIENPYTGPIPPEFFKDNYKTAQSAFFDILRSKGHDGWIPAEQGGKLAVVLKEPHQIKTVNNRTWDPKNPRMDKAEGGGVLPHGHPEREENLRAFNPILDENGNPKVFYHGTNKKDFSEFKLPGRKGTGGNALFASEDPATASYFARNVEDSRVYPVYISANNIFNHEDPEHAERLANFVYKNHGRLFPGALYGPETSAKWARKGDYNILENPAVSQWMKKQGHDAFYVRESEDRPQNIGVFSPTQIKSATGNQGTFDPNDPDITKATGGEVEDESITAYHGSPYDFDRFDLSKIGTGEGVQAYGHGLYKAESPEVARGYRDSTMAAQDMDPDMRIGSTPIEDYYARLEQQLARMPAHQAKQGYNRLSMLEDLMHGGDVLHVRSNAEQGAYDPEAMEWFEKEIAPNFQRQGRLYEVHIDAHPDHFLDWDKRLSQQSSHVKGALKTMLGADWIKAVQTGMTGGELHSGLAAPEHRSTVTQKIGSAQDVSQKLHEMGIKGIRYLDQGSRDEGAGTHNYVVFDDKLVDVKKKYADGGVVKERDDGKEAREDRAARGNAAGRPGRSASVNMPNSDPVVERALMIVSRKA